MTGEQLVKLAGFSEVTFDYALPQPWVDMVVETLRPHMVEYRDVCRAFVWVYDAAGGIGGRPGAVLQDGNVYLRWLNEATGSTWATNPQAVDIRALELKNWARRAIEVQNACNLSGVLTSMLELVKWVRCYDPERATTPATHPLVVLFASKVESLTGYGRLFSESYAAACELAGEEAEGG